MSLLWRYFLGEMRRSSTPRQYLSLSSTGATFSSTANPAILIHRVYASGLVQRAVEPQMVDSPRLLAHASVATICGSTLLIILFYRTQSVFLNLAAVDPSVVESQNEQLVVHPPYREIRERRAPPVVLVVTSTRDVQR